MAYASDYGSNAAPPRASGPTGRQLLRATWDLLRADRELLWLPVIGGLAALAALVLVVGPALAIGWAAGNAPAGGVVGAVVGMFVSATVAVYFQAALVLGAFQRADGYDPSLSSTLTQAWAVRRQVLQWALLSTTVGLTIRVVERRLGFIGALIGFLGGLAWAIASFFTVPVLVAEGLGPIDATRRSVALMKQVWGSGLRSSLRLGFVGLVLVVGCYVPLAAGVFILASGTTAGVGIGTALIVVGVLALLAVGMILSAVYGYARALLYRFAVGRPVPGIPAELYAGAFVPKRRWGRRR